MTDWSDRLDLRGSGQRQPGPDHPHHAWSPMPGRIRRSWPNGAGVAVCPVLALDNHEDEVPADWPQPQWAAGGVGPRPDPNIARIGARDYGARRGFWRLAQELRDAGLPYALALDVLTAETHPELVEACLRGDAGRLEWVAHGLSWNRPQHAGMSEAEELEYLQQTRDRLAARGITSSAWLGIEYAQSPRTPVLLQRAGYRICLDWCNDEQPYRFRDTQGSEGLWSLPPMADLDDGFALCAPRGVTAAAYARRLVDAAAALAQEGRTQARVMVFVLRPFLCGQPFRIDHVAHALQRMRDLPGVWFARPGEILAAWQQIAEPSPSH